MRRLREEFSTSERRVCGLMEIPRMSCRYRSRRDDNALRQRLVELAREKPRFGYRRLHVMLRRDQPEARINHKRVWRVYHDLGLSVRRTRRKRLTRVLRPRPLLTAPNQEWAIDFASDVTAGGRRLRIFSVVDCYTRECLTLEVDTWMPSRRVTRALAAIMETPGAPVVIRSDNGSEMTSRHYLAWCIERRIDALHIQPGKPTQNAHVESFHGRLRDECLNVEVFFTPADARRKLHLWRRDYNHYRPHSALDDRTSAEFAARCGRGKDGGGTALEDAARLPLSHRTTTAGITGNNNPSTALLEALA